MGRYHAHLTISLTNRTSVEALKDTSPLIERFIPMGKDCTYIFFKFFFTILLQNHLDGKTIPFSDVELKLPQAKFASSSIFPEIHPFPQLIDRPTVSNHFPNHNPSNIGCLPSQTFLILVLKSTASLIFVCSDRSSYSDDVPVQIQQATLSVLTQSIDAIDVSRVTLSRLIQYQCN